MAETHAEPVSLRERMFAVRRIDQREFQLKRQPVKRPSGPKPPRSKKKRIQKKWQKRMRTIAQRSKGDTP